MLAHHFETKLPATNRTSECWGTTSRPRHRQQIVHISAGAPLRDQDTGNKSYILVLGLRDQDTSNKSYIFVLGTTSRARHRQQIVHLSAGAPLRRHQQQNVHLSAGAPLRDQDTGNKSYIFVLGYHIESKTPATNRASQCWGTTSRPRHRQQIIHLSAGAALDHDIGNKSYILVLGHHFETKTPTSDQDTGNKSYICVLGHDFETKPPATNRLGHRFETTTPATNRAS